MPEPVTIIAVSTGLAGLAAHLANRYFEAAKEVFDVLAGLVLLVAAMPVLLLCAALIRLSSQGPVLYTQVRVGKNGNLFTMYKMRTMYLGAEGPSGAVWAQDNDPRVIPACRWMRRSHMDELPQLLNVVRGEMSLVGPRPERPEILADLAKVYPEVNQRLAVRPGITGLAQVRNGYDTTIDAFRNKLRSDLEYIELRRWGMEISILARTLGKFNDKTAH